jgi:RimJ/RimL family protein N-acetyltransferase
MVSRNDRSAIGHCGFHGPPEMIGRAEIGYTVFTRYRGQGYAKEAAAALVEWAFSQGESEVYASVAPENAPSLAVVRSSGFIEIGTQIDEVDGLEVLFVRRRSPAA